MKTINIHRLLSRMAALGLLLALAHPLHAQNDKPAATWQLYHRCEKQSEILWDVKFSPDGSRIVTACYDGSGLVWDTKTGKKLAVLKLPPLQDRDRSSCAGCVDWSRDGSKILVGGPPVVIWDANTYQQLHVFPVDEGIFFTHGKIALCGGDQSSGYGGNYPFSFWSTVTGKELAGKETGLDSEFRDKIETEEYILFPDSYSISPSDPPDHQYIISQSDTIRLWDLEKQKQVQTLTPNKPLEFVQASISNNNKVAAVMDKLQIDLFEIGRNQPIQTIKIAAEEMALSPDGMSIAFWESSSDHISFYDVKSGKLASRITLKPDTLRDVAWSPDGMTFATVGMDKELLIWKKSAK